LKIEGWMGAAAHVIHSPRSLKSIIDLAPKMQVKEYFEHTLSDGLTMEFGVAGGGSITEIAGLNPGHTIYGFDSYQGLPERWRESFEVGHFAGDPPTDLPKNVELVIGQFQDTLVPWLKAHPDHVRFAHIDCDVYSSAKFVLTALTPYCVSGTIIAFDEIVGYDEYYLHEAKAFAEFVNETGYGFECIGQDGQRAVFRMLV
jgi:hypothetical protein